MTKTQLITILSDQEIAKVVWNLYSHSPRLIRTLAALRTFTCPMQALLAEVPTQSTIFDIGCGSGLFLSLLIANHQIIKAVGCDPNALALNNAKTVMNQLVATGEKVTVELFEAEDPQHWPNNSFSVVSLIDVMHHISPQKQRTIFEAAAQRVEPGGRLIYKDIGERPLWQGLANRLHDLILARQWINYVSIETIKIWGASCQLELEKEAYYPRYVYANELLVFKKLDKFKD